MALEPGVRTWDGASSTLPPGEAGLAIRVGSTDERLPGARGPIVGIDGRTVLRGWGEAYLVVPPGEHVVDAHYGRPRKEERFALTGGEVTWFTYDADNAALAEAGALAAAAARHRARPRERGMSLTLLVALACLAVFGALGLVDGMPLPVTVAAMLLGPTAGACVAQFLWRRHLRRHGIDYWSLAPYAAWRSHEASQRDGARES